MTLVLPWELDYYNDRKSMWSLGWFDFAKIGKSINRRIKSIETD